MEINYEHREGSQSVKPSLVDTNSSKTVVYLRKNVNQTSFKDAMSGKTITMWSYDEAVLSLAEFEEYKTNVSADISAQMRADNTDMMDAIATNYEQSASAEQNQLSIMSAIADLYELVNSKGGTTT